MPKPNFNSLKHPQFLIALCIMLVNDLWLKPYFHNWVTGKISDIAGLYIFPVFLCGFFPAYKKQAYIFTALLFTFWKSEWSEPLMELLKTSHIYVGRTVDYTDLLTLPVLLLSFKYSGRGGMYLLPVGARLIAALSLVVFCGDSIVRHQYSGPSSEFYYGNTIPTILTKDQFFKRLDSLGMRYYPDSTVHGSYYYDTSSWSSHRTVENTREVVRFWRVKNYVCAPDTIKNINFQFEGNNAINWIRILGYDAGKRYASRLPDKQRKKRYDSVIRYSFGGLAQAEN